MKRITPILVVASALLLGCSSQPGGSHAGHDDGQTHNHKHGHDHGTRGSAKLHATTEPSPPVAGQPATVKLMVHAADGQMVKDFDVVHDAKLHLIVVRDGLDRFAHIHPDIDAAGHATVRHTFPTGGKYHLFADYQPRGGSPAVAVAEVQVAGESPPAPALAPNAPGTVTGDGLTARVAVEGAKPGAEATIRFELSDAAGPVNDLELYMGALGHLNVVSADAKQFVHSHPSPGGGAKNIVSFQAHFPAAGVYKGWGQFKRAGRVHVVPFVVKVG
jgi:hypothetical protein